MFLGPPGTGKTLLAIGLAIRACQAGHRVLFATAAEWVARLAERRQGVKIRASLTRVAAPGRHSLAATARGAANAEPCTTTCKPGNRGRLGKGQSSTQVDHGRLIAFRAWSPCANIEPFYPDSGGFVTVW